MNKPVFENQRELNCKKTIVILSIISLICEVLSFIPYFVACYWVDGKAYYQLVQYTSARSFIFMILNIALCIAPRVLLIDYSIILFHKPKANIVVPIIFVSTTIPVLLVFGEITPKIIATHHPEAVAFFFSFFVQIIETLLFPLVMVFTSFSRLVLKVFKINVKPKKVSYTEEEIKTFLDVGCEQGILKVNEKNMMSQVFKFTDLEAKDIMIPRKQNIVGIIYIKDMLSFKNRASEFSVQKTMRPPLFILETKKMSGVQQMLWENRQSMAVVIDEYSGTYGILTREDIVREIFGPVTDGKNIRAHKADLIIENTHECELDGFARLIDLNEKLGINLSSENCETIGGFICEKLGSIPQEGNFILAEGYKFTVIKMEDNRVKKIKMQKDGEQK